MKISQYSFCLILCFIFSFSAQAQWMQTGGPLGGHNIHFAKSTGGKLWASTPDGIQYSTNDGNTWQKAFPNTNIGNYVLAFGDTIFAVITDYSIYVPSILSNSYSIVSYDNGISWPDTNEWYSLNVSVNLYNVEKSTSKIYQITMGQSSDMGATWSPIPTGVLGATISEIQAYKQYVAQNEQTTIGYSTVSFDDHNSIVYSAPSYPNKVVGVMDSIIFFENSSTSIVKLLRSTTLGASFDTVLQLPFGYSFGGCSNFHPNNDTIYLTAINVSSLQNDIVYRSLNKGITWQPMSNNFSSQYKNEIVKTASNEFLYEYLEEVKKFNELTDTFTLFNNSIKGRRIFDLISSNNSLYSYGLDFLYRSDDNGVSWTNISPNKAFYQNPYSCHGVEHDTLFVTYVDTLFYSFNKGNSWSYTLDTLPWIQNYYYLHHGLLYTLSDSFKYSSDFGLTWNVANGGVLTNSASRNFFTDRDTLFCYENGSWPALCYLNTQTNSFDYISNSPMSGNYIRINGIWLFYSGNNLQYSLDGIFWTNCNTGPIGSFSIWGQPVFLNGIYYCTLDRDKLYFSANGIDWQKAESLDMNIFYDAVMPINYRDITAHNGKLYKLSTFRSVWVLDDTLYSYQGEVYFDDNNNGIKDAIETSCPNTIVATPNYFTNTNATGSFNLFCFNNNDTLKVSLPQNYISNPAYHLIDNNSFFEKNFGIYCPISFIDNKVDLTNTAVFNPGFQTHLITTIKNEGSIASNPTLTLTIDTNLTFVSSIPTPTSVVGNVYTFTIPTLEKLTSTSVDMIVATNVGTALLTPILCIAQLDTIADVSPSNNTNILSSEVVGSFDPNDKTCKQGTTFTTSQIANDEALEYTIRFQNTGSFPTSFVKILDTLSSKMDLSTFKFIGSSHPVSMDLNYNGIIGFNFNPLMLPDSGSNETESHGFVKYSIEPRENVQIGDVLMNTAYIYFDYNAPIVTNTTSTEIIGSLTLNTVKNKSNLLKIYPNPTDHLAYLDLENIFSKNCKAFIYNMMGEEVYCLPLNHRLTKINTATWNPGTYLIVVRNATNEVVVRGKLAVLDK